MKLYQINKIYYIETASETKRLTQISNILNYGCSFYTNKKFLVIDDIPFLKHLIANNNLDELLFLENFYAQSQANQLQSDVLVKRPSHKTVSNICYSIYASTDAHPDAAEAYTDYKDYINEQMRMKAEAVSYNLALRRAANAGYTKDAAGLLQAIEAVLTEAAAYIETHGCKPFKTDLASKVYSIRENYPSLPQVQSFITKYNYAPIGATKLTAERASARANEFIRLIEAQGRPSSTSLLYEQMRSLMRQRPDNAEVIELKKYFQTKKSI